MSLDRVAALRQAEKLLRLGKLDQAIAEYHRLADEQPHDWNTGNLLGDLLLRAGQTDRAIEQFTRIADSLQAEGFLSKASALYKKVLKLQPESDHALMQAGELAAQQGLLVDARSFLSQALDRRRKRGDTTGAWEIVVRLGTLDSSDVAARLDGARARIELGDIPAAMRELQDTAEMLIEQGRDDEALAALREIVQVDATNVQAAKQAARILITQGKPDEATALLAPDRFGADPAAMLAAAEIRIRHGSLREGLALIDRLLSHDVADLSGVGLLVESVAGQRPDTGYALAARAADARIHLQDWMGAALMLRYFNNIVPRHVEALTRLVDVCVDGELRDEVLPAQELLADAHLAAGSAAEARVVAEDLVIREPWERANFDRLRSALAMSGELNPDAALADWLTETPDLEAVEKNPVRSETEPQAPNDGPPPPPPPVQDPVPLVRPVPPGATVAPWSVATEAVVGRGQTEARPATRNSHAINLESVLGPPTSEPAPPPPAAPTQAEVDLSLALEEIRPMAQGAPGSGDIDAVFAHLRASVVDRPADEGAELAFIRGRALYDAGELGDAAESFRAASRAPHRRFAAALMLSRIYRDQRRIADAIEWLGHAVETPVPNPIDRYEALLQLADLLEATGEPARALATCLELQADAGDYKDVATRLARLSGAQDGS